MADEKRKLGILLFSGPDSSDIDTATGLAAAALRRGVEVEIFMMYKAVLSALNEKLKIVAKQGAKITLCAYNATELKAERNEELHYGSQYDNAQIVNSSQRYVAFV